MKMLPEETKIQAADGGERRYVTTRLPFDPAYRLGLKLSEMIGGSAGTAFAALFTGDDTEGLDADAAVTMANAITGLPRALIAADTALLDEILASTWTPGEDGEKQVKIALGTSGGRANAWGGGLSQEPFRVIGWVLWVNFGPLLPGGSEGFETLLARARAWWKNFGQGSQDEPESEPSESGGAKQIAGSG
jgi:hypothetical protein